MPLGKVNTALAGNSYGSGAVGLAHAATQSGAASTSSHLQYGKGVGGASSYGDGAMLVETAKNAPRVQDKKYEYGKGVGGTSQVGNDAISVQSAVNAPKAKSENLGQVDKKL